MSNMASENAHAAKIIDGVVERVIVIPRQKDDRDDLITEYCNSLGLEGTWIDTSYLGNRRGVFATIGATYDKENDIFISPEIEQNDDSEIPDPIEYLMMSFIENPESLDSYKNGQYNKDFLCSLLEVEEDQLDEIMETIINSI